MKHLTAKEVAMEVLKKADECLKKAEFLKKNKKKENPDEKEDAKLGEKIEHVVEEHMLENKDAERKEGHKIVEKAEVYKKSSSINKLAKFMDETKSKKLSKGNV